MDNKIVGTYQIESELGIGGMGRVYRAVDTRTNTPVAIKQLKPELTDSEMIERFQREAEALRELNHPNMVKMLDTIDDETSHYLVMEYVSGGDLRQLIEQEQLSIERSLQIAIDLADALTRAHRLGIIHRDLKPANVLIAEDGTPRLTDFGIALMSNRKRVTETNAVLGTIDYLPPEVFQNAEIDNRADIWAFGVMLYEMLTGERPFIGDSTTQVVFAIVSRDIPDLETLCPDAPIELVDLVYRMLERDPSARIASVRHVGAALEDILYGRSTHTPPETRFSSLASSEPKKHNLPTQATAFVGREAELAELGKLLDNPNIRLVTIVAQGGMGKTRLTIEAAERYLEHFADGVYFVELAPLLDSDNIVLAIGDALGYDFQDHTRTKKEELLDFLSNQELLLLMDNFEHLLDGASLVADILDTAPHVQILVSSRQSLKLSHETIFNLQGMDFPTWETPDDALEYAAVKLFLQSARRVQPQFEITADNMDAIARICKLVNGMPLGILLAASWVSMLSPEEIAKEITQSIDILESDLSDLPKRQQSIRVVFDYSWQTMTSDEQVIFMKMCLFQGGFTREAAQAVTGANLRSLMSLMNKSLIRRNVDNGRYEIHELLRQYSYEKLEASGELDTTRDAHSSYYLHFVGEREADLIGRRQVETLNEIDLDFENFRAAWMRALETMDYEGIELALESLCIYLGYRSRWEDENPLITGAEERFAPQAGAEPPLVWGMILARNNGHHDDPIEALQMALEIAIKHDNPFEIGWCYQFLGGTYSSLGKHAEALRYHEMSLPYFEAVGDIFHIAAAYEKMVWAYRGLADFENGMKYNEKSLELFKQVGNRPGQSIAIWNLYLSNFNSGELEKSEFYIREAFSLAQQVEHMQYMGFFKHILASFFSLGVHGDLDEFHQIMQESLHYWEQINRQQHGVRRFMQSLQAAFAGDYDTAYPLGEAALGQLEIQSPYFWYPIFAWGLLMADCERGNYEIVRQHSYNILTFFYELRVLPFILFAFTFEAILAAYDDENPQRATELLALTRTHPGSMSGWLKLWPFIERLHEYLENELGTDAYQAAWERGKNLDWETVVSELIAEYGDEDTGAEVNIPAHILEANAQLFEPLSERELEVLLKIAEGYSNKEIAEQLFVGVSTVKKHITHIYGKLEVDSRTQALIRAQELNLV